MIKNEKNFKWSALIKILLWGVIFTAFRLRLYNKKISHYEIICWNVCHLNYFGDDTHEPNFFSFLIYNEIIKEHIKKDSEHTETPI